MGRFMPRLAEQRDVADDARPLPEIPRIEIPLQRLDLSRKPPVAEVVAEVERAGRVGVWQFNKKWEIIINALESTDMPPVLGMSQLPSLRTWMRLASRRS